MRRKTAGKGRAGRPVDHKDFGKCENSGTVRLPPAVGKALDRAVKQSGMNKTAYLSRLVWVSLAEAGLADLPELYGQLEELKKERPAGRGAR